MSTSASTMKTIPAKRVPMDSLRKTALIGGGLYLLTFISSIPRGPSVGPGAGQPGLHHRLRQRHPSPLGLLPRSDQRLRLYRHRRRAVPGRETAKRQRRARLRHLPRHGGRDHRHRRRQPSDGRDPATGPGRNRRRDAASLVTTGQSLVATRDWTFLLGPDLMAGINALLLGSLMYRSRLVPRVIPLMGLIGGPLLIAASIAIFFGASSLRPDRRHPSGAVGVLPRCLPRRQRLQTLRHHS